MTARLTEVEVGATLTREGPSALPGEDRKVVDPVAVIGVVPAIPGAILAVADIIDRVRKRRKAEALIGAARHLRRDRQVQVDVTTADGSPRALDQLTPDDLLEIAGTLKQISTRGA